MNSTLEQSREQNRSDLFLVRVWPAPETEEISDHGAAWHGRVQHVLTGEAHNFEDLRVLVSRLEGMLQAGAVTRSGNQNSA